MIRIFDIKKFALQDGDGIRTTIFLKGCPLRCAWCHNPESLSFEIEKLTQTKLFDGAEIQTLEYIGRDITTQELWQEIQKDIPFYSTSKGGGVTFSGGEPLTQLEGLLEILALCKENGLHTAVDTSGFAPAKVFDRLIESNLVDLLLYDIKMVDSQAHKESSGVYNEIIHRNLFSIIEKGIRVQLRLPMIPNHTIEPNNIEQLIELLKQVKCSNISEVALLPYHNTAQGKIAKFGYKSYMPKGLHSLQKEELYELEERLTKLGWRVTFH